MDYIILYSCSTVLRSTVSHREMWLRTLEIAIPDSIAARSSVDRAELYTESDGRTLIFFHLGG